MKPGYKQTEVGVIPEDWEIRRCAEISERIMVGIVIRPTQYYAPQGVPALRSANIREDGITDSDLVFISEASNALLTKSQTRAGDILTVRTGYPGTSAVVRPVHAGCNCIDILITRPSKKVDSDFLATWINSSFGKEQVLRNQGGLAQKHFNVGDMRNLVAALPPLSEQRAIAAALSDVDALLAALDRLIAKKRDLKQAAMQQLLTGQTRLPGFTGEWAVKRLGEIGVFLKGSGVKKDETQSGPLPCIRYGEIYTKHNDVVAEFHSFISIEVAATAKLLKKGDVLFAGSGETKEEIGKCVAFVDECEAYAGGDIVILRPQGADSRFLGYALNTPAINRQKASRGQGDAVVHIGSSALSEVAVNIPPLPEQTAIASVLSDMDAELAALEQRREKTRALKQGMMQELLTGRTRLVVPASVEPRAANNVSVDFPPVPEAASSGKSHNWAINEAVVVAVLAKNFGSEKFPLGRKRCTKLSYLLHRHVERVAEGYLKKAAGPYNPSVKYKGPEGIAQKNGYIRPHKNGSFSGFVAGDKVGQAEGYFEKWYGLEALAWLEQFRFKSNDELELLATVDMAAEDLRREGKEVNLANLKSVIASHTEWKAKLNREIFSDSKIERAAKEAAHLFH